MKRILTSIVLFALIVNGFSQPFFTGRTKVKGTQQLKSKSIINNVPKSSTSSYSEDFQTGVMPAGMTIINQDGSPLPPAEMPEITAAWGVIDADDYDQSNFIAFSSSFEAVPNAADWMITPKITIGSGSYLEWRSMVYFAYDGTNQEYEVYVTTTIAGTTPVASDFTNAPVFTTIDSTSSWKLHAVDLEAAGYANTDVWIAFKNISAGSDDPFLIDILFIDDISVNTPFQVDAELSSINIPSINGMTLPISGTIKNLGVDPITSFDVSYNVDGGTESAIYHVSGVNIAKNESYDFTHDVSAVFTVSDNYTINVTISNVNGTTDGDLLDNTLSKDIIIGADNELKKTTLFEYFGSNNVGEVGDLYALAQTNFQTLYSNNPENWPKASIIAYELSPDPYQITECVNRNNYYTPDWDPGFFTNGSEGDFSQLNNLFTNELYDQPAFFGITANHSVAGNTITADITINPYANANLVCHVAVVEMTTTGNHGSSAATSYHNVLMKMLPNANGTKVNLVNGSPTTLSLSYDMTSTHVEEMSDLSVVVFLQDSVTKEVFQSTSSAYPLGVNDQKSASLIHVFPNPSTGLVSISNEENANIRVFDMVGNLVVGVEKAKANTIVDLSAQPIGTYVIQVLSDKNVFTQKVNIIR